MRNKYFKNRPGILLIIKVVIAFIYIFNLNLSAFSQQPIPCIKFSCEPIYIFDVPSCPESSLKNGYYLLLNESFQGDVDSRWERSGYWDDSKDCCDTFMRNRKNITYEIVQNNTKNVTPPGPPALITHAHIWNTNEPISPCYKYSSGEIKTFNSCGNPNFKNYYFYGSGYVEAKVKLFSRTA